MILADAMKSLLMKLMGLDKRNQSLILSPVFCSFQQIITDKKLPVTLNNLEKYFRNNFPFRIRM